ncbi:hypothetical protein [Sphingomonas sp.]|uniref:hypothetical protein n=1 Tax=Sphingomonas sp. TaxID=28214 RepID=UPI003B00D76A
MRFRAALSCLLLIALALTSALVGHATSYDFATKIGAQAVDNILDLPASSIVDVTTFSLTNIAG